MSSLATRGFCKFGTTSIMKMLDSCTCDQQRWSSGRIPPCHGGDPGSIPGRCTRIRLFFAEVGVATCGHALYYNLVRARARKGHACVSLFADKGWPPSFLQLCLHVHSVATGRGGSPSKVLQLVEAKRKDPIRPRPRPSRCRCPCYVPVIMSCPRHDVAPITRSCIAD